MDAKLSYKFQRLRERLREAVTSGELSGKLPGERQLAKKFNVNAKTLSKALTDLAAEGLLDRSIGRGTFVKSSIGEPQNGPNKWLILCDPECISSGVIQHLSKLNPETQIITDVTSLRPSALTGVQAVIDFSWNTPDALLRSLIVRNIAVVIVGREPRTYSVNAVLVDRALGGSLVAREMLLGGHNKFLAVERRGAGPLTESIVNTAKRFGTQALVESVSPQDVVGALEQTSATAVICDSRKSGGIVAESLQRRGISVPGDVSLAAIGSGWGVYPCSGYYVSSEQKAQSVAELISNAAQKRPTTLWLTGSYVDQQSIAPVRRNDLSTSDGVGQRAAN